AAASLERFHDRASERCLGRAGLGRRHGRNLCFRRDADGCDVAYSDWAVGVSVTLRVACEARHDGARPSRMANLRSGPNEPIRCKPAARSDCIGKKALKSERLARSMAKVRLMTSGRRADA